LLIDRNPTFELTEDVVVAAVGSRSGLDVLELLLKRVPNIKITEVVVVAAANSVA
jgi:hypothetical protein